MEEVVKMKGLPPGTPTSEPQAGGFFISASMGRNTCAQCAALGM